MQGYNRWELLKSVLGEMLSIMCSDLSITASISWTQMCICKFNFTLLIKSLQSLRLSPFITHQDIILILVDAFYYECDWNGAQIIVQRTKMICLKHSLYHDVDFQCQFYHSPVLYLNDTLWPSMVVLIITLDTKAYLCILAEISRS